MPALKLVYMFVVAIFALLLFVFFSNTLSGVGHKVTDVLFDFVGGGGDKLQCAVGITGNDCSKITDQEACMTKGEGRECLWCQGEVNGAIVGSCQARACGCGNLRSTNVVEISPDMGELFRPGDTLYVKGSVRRSGQILNPDGTIIQAAGVLSGLTIEYSFLDGGRKETDSLGLGGKAVTDEKGGFEIEHVIPEGAPRTKYYVYVSFADAKDWEDFQVG